MRLINVKTLEIQEFFDTNIPRYAILSHTWGAEEVTYQDWLYARQQNPPRWGWVYIEEEVAAIRRKPGHLKIVNACRQASKDQLSWIWVDTNCIDKTSSAELSSAINSMYRWYEKAEICYAFLADVPPSSPEQCSALGSKFRRSRWFTRGWTLQELIAPQEVVFFSEDWVPIGEKRQIANTVQDITNIPYDIVTEPRHLSCGHASIAEIMTWASMRRTSRTEDLAYCLMGLLGVNMPLLYGEGQNAFIRLQLEAIQKTSDVTFLGWQRISLQPRRVADIPITERYARHRLLRHREALASGPEAFYLSRSIHKTDEPCRDARHVQAAHWRTDNPMNIRINNLGMSLNLPLVKTLTQSFSYAVLPFSQHGRRLWMPLLKSGRVYKRVEFPLLTFSVSNEGLIAKEEEITLPVNPQTARQHSVPIISNPKFVASSGRRSPSNILLAFPAGLQGYKCLCQFFPTLRPFEYLDSLALSLYVDEDLPSIAYGAIEFERFLEPESSESTDDYGQASVSSRLAVFFAVDLGDADYQDPRRWTCRDISASRFENRYRGYSRYPYALELRTRSQLVTLSDPFCDEMVPPMWERRSLLRKDGAQTGHGSVFLDDRAMDFSRTPNLFFVAMVTDMFSALLLRVVLNLRSRSLSRRSSSQTESTTNGQVFTSTVVLDLAFAQSVPRVKAGVFPSAKESPRLNTLQHI